MSNPDGIFDQALVDVHGNYRSGRLNHEPPDAFASDEVTPAVLGPHLVRSGLFFFVEVVLGAALLLGLILYGLGKVQQALSFGTETGLGSVGSVILVLASIGIAAVGVLWVIALFKPLKEPIAEYGLLIEGRASAQPAAYAWIQRTAQERRSPFRPRFARSGGIPVMALEHGRERGFALVCPIGVDLFMGWSMWRERSTVTVIGNMLREIFQRDTYAADLRTATTRALREMIHSLVREGVQAAITSTPISDQQAQAVMSALPPLSETGYGTTGPPFAPPVPFAGPQAAGPQPPWPPPGGYAYGPARPPFDPE